MLNKSPAQIAEDDLLALIADQESEGKMIDYKSTIVGPSASGIPSFSDEPEGCCEGIVLA